MIDNFTTRRRVLRNAVAGITVAGVTGTVSAQGASERKIVGLRADAGFATARRAADDVRHELDFGRIGKAVAGTFSDQAIEGLENNPNVRYVEDDGRVEAFAQTLPWGIDRVDADVAHDNG